MVRECGQFGCFFGLSGPFQQEPVIGVAREIRLPGTWITATSSGVDPESASFQAGFEGFREDESMPAPVSVDLACLHAPGRRWTSPSTALIHSADREEPCAA